MKALLSAELMSLMLTTVAHAAVDTYEFDSDADRQRYRQLTAELRCPKCQNQNIADSNAPIAMDLRQEIYRLLGEGKSNEEVVEHLVLRYGDFVRYKPPFDQRTWLLWVGPFALLGMGALLMGLIVRRRRSASQSASVATLSAEEREHLAQLLDKKDS